MKVILGIICGLVVLFAGGCALYIAFAGLANGGLVFAAIPGGIAALNILVLLALWGQQPPQRWAFYLLAVLDVVAAVLTGVFWNSISFQVTDIWTIAVPVIAVLLLKAVLTVLVSRQLEPEGPSGPPPAGPPGPRQG